MLGPSGTCMANIYLRTEFSANLFQKLLRYTYTCLRISKMAAVRNLGFVMLSIFDLS